jgi:hypothetical protein
MKCEKEMRKKGKEREKDENEERKTIYMVFLLLVDEFECNVVYFQEFPAKNWSFAKFSLHYLPMNKKLMSFRLEQTQVQ